MTTSMDVHHYLAFSSNLLEDYKPRFRAINRESENVWLIVRDDWMLMPINEFVNHSLPCSGAGDSNGFSK